MHTEAHEARRLRPQRPLLAMDLVGDVDVVTGLDSVNHVRPHLDVECVSRKDEYGNHAESLGTSQWIAIEECARTTSIQAQAVKRPCKAS